MLILHAFVTFFVILDPVGTATIFAGLMRGVPPEEREPIAWRGVFIAGVLLLVFAFFGEPLLRALGISLPALRVAGGILLFLVATDMVFVRATGIRNLTGGEIAEAENRDDIAVFPLAFPLIAGPGALTSIVLLIGRAETTLDIAIVIGALAAALALTLIALLSSARLANLLGITGTNVVSRVLGIVLAALAAQFVFDGVAGWLQR